MQGPALVRIRDGQDSEYPDPGRCGDAIFGPPGIAHAVQNLGTRPMLLVASSDLAYDPKAPDVVCEILIEA